MKHMTCGENGLSLLVCLPVRPEQIAIAADDLIALRIPDNQLPTTIFHGIKLVDIHRLTRSSSRRAESFFAKTPDFLHHMGRLPGRYDIDFVMTLVRHTKLAVGSQLPLEELPVNRLDNLFFHFQKS